MIALFKTNQEFHPLQMLYRPLVLFLLELLDCIINTITLREVCLQQVDNQTSLHPNLPPTFHISQCLSNETQRRHLPYHTYPPLPLLSTTKKLLNIINHSNGQSQQQILSIKVIMLPHGKWFHPTHHTMQLEQMWVWVWEGVQNTFRKTMLIKMNTCMMFPVKVYPDHSHKTTHTKYLGL